MSVADIINELPRLSDTDRRAVREALLSIANRDSEVALCNDAALQAAIMFDRLEDEHARNQSR